METNRLATPDMFHMAVIKAFLEKEPDDLEKITVSKFRQKVVAIYSDREGLPFLSQIKVTWGKHEVSLDDFKLAFFEIKDKVFGVMKSENENNNDTDSERVEDDGKHGKRQETTD